MHLKKANANIWSRNTNNARRRFWEGAISPAMMTRPLDVCQKIDFLSSYMVSANFVFSLYKPDWTSEKRHYSVFRKIHTVTSNNIQTLQNEKISIKFAWLFQFFDYFNIKSSLRSQALATPPPPLGFVKLQNSPPAIGLIVHLHFAKGKKLRTKSLGQQNTTF